MNPELSRAVSDVFTALGAVLAVGGGIAAVAFGLFRWFGAAWLDQHFKLRLDALKHEQQKEIEHLRHEINSLYSRVSKVHEKEFEVLPEAWRLLNEAYGALYQAISPIREELDLNSLSGDQFEEFLKSSELPPSAQTELRSSQDRFQTYARMRRQIERNQARRARMLLNNYLSVNSIFLTCDLRKQLKEVNLALGGILIDEEIGMEAKDAKLRQSASTALGNIPQMVETIEAAVQKRLRYDEA